MKILLTGANGFLASNVVRELNKRCIPVRAMVRSTADLRSLHGTNVEYFSGNIANIMDALEAVKGCDVVIHAAADTSQHYLTYEPYVKTNVMGTFNMLEAAKKNNIKRFILISTANAFGYGSKSNPGNERIPARYPFTSSGYAMSKLKAQELVLDYADKFETIVVNPTFMIGPNDTKPSSGKIITMIYHRKVIPIPPGGKNFIDVRDAAYGICNAIDKGKPGSCYLLANENLSYEAFYNRLGKITGKSFSHVKLAPGLLSAMGMIGQLAVRSGFKTDLNRINAEILCTDNYYSSAKAVKELGLPQTSVDIAIGDGVEWFINSGYLKN